MMRLSAQQRISLTILVAALGYFVDVFDMQLFSTVRVSSLKSLGLSPDGITTVGAHLLNWQMAGMLLGGILWGMLGDKKGRVYVLFGTILLYSIGNIANAFVTTIPAYAAARFFTGLGLAGEIGAGITLAAELLPKNTRGYATTIVVTCGVMGPVVAALMADALDWRMAYIAGGVLGLLLLALRVAVSESGMFHALQHQPGLPRGRLRMFITNPRRLYLQLSCIASALPIWFVLGVLVIFSPEIGTALHIDNPIKASTSVINYFVGITLGGILSGVLSQIFKSRKKIMAVFILGTALSSWAVLTVGDIAAPRFYLLILIAGFCTGYWCLFMTSTAEQFGTNLRATATTTAANFVRASVIIDTLLIGWMKPSFGYIDSIMIVGGLCVVVAFLALWHMPETFGRDLDFIER